MIKKNKSFGGKQRRDDLVLKSETKNIRSR